MEKYVEITSPFTGGRAKEVFTTEIKEFRKEKFLVNVRYYVCEDTGEQFTTTEQDTLQFNHLYSQYRIRHGIPFPDEIMDIRKRYRLNYSQISRILGFGANQYAKYEAGEVPSESNGKMIAAIKDKNVILGLLRGCKDIFNATEYDRIYTSIMTSEDGPEENQPLFSIIFHDRTRSIFNGFGMKRVEKTFEMVRYIIATHGEVFPTKLNKLMFYADFCNFRKTGQSISGLQYRALDFGPVPDHYATIYDNVPGLVRKEIEAHGLTSTLFSCADTPDINELTPTEKESIDTVVAKFKPLSVKETIEASHREQCWEKYFSLNTHIPYDEAFSLRMA